ncbi:MAG: hypothetical protein IKX27_00435 [Oscillospiraceae bacterium]|nr:hypothetical protein [Oscillospiraceae bacterium]
MKKKEQSFVDFFLSAARASGAALPVRLLYAVVLAAVCCCVVFALPALLPSAADRLPGYLFDSSEGAVYVYAVLATVIIIISRMIVSKLFVFDEILSGKWELASRCGADLKTRCLAKALFAFWAPMSTYCIGAVIFCAAVRLIGGSGFTGFGQHIKLLLVGLLTMLLVFSLEIIFAALGAQKSALPFICLPFLILALVLWYWKGFFSVSDPADIGRAADELLAAAPTGLPILAPVAFIAALWVCMTVPVKRTDRYAIEDLDDEMLKILEFREDQEVYEKTSEGYELIFTGKEVIKNR